MPQMPPLSDDGLKELLSKQVVAKLATTSAKDEIRITPFWFEARDGIIIVSTWEETAAARQLKRNPRCSLLIDTTEYPYSGIHYWGTATVEGPANDSEGMGKMFARYMGGDVEAATQYANQLISWGKRVYIHFKPERNAAWDFGNAS